MENIPPIPEHKNPEKAPFSTFIAWVILLICLAATGVITHTTKKAVENEAQKDFSNECKEIKASLDSKLYAYSQLLRTGAAFFEASDTVERRDWDIFINYQKIDTNLPGTQGVGYAILLEGKSVSQHEKHIRSEGFPDYSVKPAGKRSFYTPIVYLEPFSGRNLRAFGYDMFSEPIRRVAMEKARDMDIATLSGKVMLEQETETDIQSGALMYVPVYQREMPVQTIAERRKAIKGWVYSPYRMNDLMIGIIGEQELRKKNKIFMQVYDNDSIREDALLFDSQLLLENKSELQHVLELTLPVDFNGKHWLLSFKQAKQISSYYFNENVLIVFFGCIAISILIFLLALLLLQSRNRVKITTIMARHLKANLDKHVALYNAIPDAVFVTDSTTGRIEEVNSKASQQYGYTYQEFTLLQSSELSSLSGQAEYYENKDSLFYHDQFHKRKDGTVLPVEITSSTFEINNLHKIISVARDITVRVQEETELSLKNEAFESSIAAQGITDRNGIFTHVNQAFVKMSGYASAAEVIGCTIESFFADKTGTEKDLDILFTIGSWQGEFRAKRKDGSIFMAKSFATSIRNKQGETIGYQTTILDITKEKAADLALETSKEHYRKVVENANDAIVVSTPDRIVFANQKLCEILGYGKNEVIDAFYLKYIHPDDQDILIPRYMQLMKGDALHKVPARILTKEGLTRWAEFSGIVIEWDGQPAVLSFIADITERKMAEDALRVSEELYKTTINASPDTIIVTDLNAEIIMASPAVISLFGIEDINQLLGKDFKEFLATHERDRATSILELILQSDERMPLNFTCIHSDGRLIETEINGEVIQDINWQPTGYVFIIRDITERKRAVDALRESEEKWRSLVNNSPDYIALHDKDGKYLFLNHFAEGYSEKDILGHTAFEFLAPESEELFRLKHNECINTWKPVRFEHMALGSHGEMRIYEESLVPILTKNAEINVLAVAKDITAQKQSAIKLQESEEHFRLIFEEGSISMALLNADFRFTQVNKAFIAYLGYSEEELLSMTFADLTDPHYIEQDLVQVNRLLKREIPVYRTEKKYLTRDKKTVWGLVQASVMYNKANEFHSLLIMINNITERKKAEESVVNSEEIFNQFMLNSPIYVFFKDENIRSLRLSRNFEKMLGRPLDELLGKTMYDLFPTEMAKNMVDDDLRVLHEGKQIEVEEEMNGRYYETTKFPIFVEGKPKYLAGYTIDITSRKLAGDIIHAALKEKEILLREVHHRVKNNLQVVSSLLNLQANKINDNALKETLGQSRNRIRSIALVHEKLYQSGNFAEINIKEYTHSLIVDLFRAYTTDPDKIHYHTEIEDINIPLMYAIPVGLILNEIISNSLKYAFPENNLLKAKPEIFISLKMLADKQLQLCAGDNGIGLPENYQLTDSASLGLYLIHILSTEQLDGKMDINTTKGTIFTITFNPFHK